MFVKSQTESKIDSAIDAQLDKLPGLEDEPEKYDATVERITKLSKLKSDKTFAPPSLDTVLVVGANVFGILWLTRFERENVIKAPNAFKMVMKPR